MLTNQKSASHYLGGMANDMEPGTGSVFYLNGSSGSATNTGLTADSPLLTMTSALALCTNDADDYIIVLDYYQPAGETWPVAVNKSKVHIIGVPGAGAQWPTMVPPGDTASMNITALGVEVARLSIQGGATAGGIHIGAAVWGIKIRDCWFGVTGASQDGIRDVAPFDAIYLSVEGCRFGQLLTRDGVRLEHNATRSSIGNAMTGKGNLFDRVPGVAINLVGQCSEVGIYNNVIAVPANTAGGAITIADGSENCIINGNRAFFGDTRMGNVPYTDSSTAGWNHWGLNYQSDIVVMPT